MHRLWNVPRLFVPLFISSLSAVFCAGCSNQHTSNTQALTSQDTSISKTADVSPAKSQAVQERGTFRPTRALDGLTVPSGFAINVFAAGLTGPRRLAIAPGGTPQKYDVFVSESSAGRVSVLRETNGDGQADSRTAFAEALKQPYGLAFWKNWLYVGNTDKVVRFPYTPGATQADGSASPVATLTQGGYNQHWTRNLLFSGDGKQLFVTVGSSCNICEETDPQRAAISVMAPDGSHKQIFASGMRNPIGMAFRPGTGELWSVVNERDNLGDDVPPDYLTLVRPNAFYGWPYAYTDIDRVVHPDPTFGSKAPEKVAATTRPDVPVQAHSAALGIAFYPTQLPKNAQGFPGEFRGDAFLAFHGSWNRSKPTGYKIVRVDFRDGKPHIVSDFVTGFLMGNNNVWGRPVDIQVAPDDSLLFSDDKGGKIWRVSYVGTGTAPKSSEPVAKHS